MKCKVCKHRFHPTNANHYICRLSIKRGLAAAFGSAEPTLFDAFDCPHCGSQIIAGVRERKYDADEIKYDADENTCEADESSSELNG